MEILLAQLEQKIAGLLAKIKEATIKNEQLNKVNVQLEEEKNALEANIQNIETRLFHLVESVGTVEAESNDSEQEEASSDTADDDTADDTETSDTKAETEKKSVTEQDVFTANKDY